MDKNIVARILEEGDGNLIPEDEGNYLKLIYDAHRDVMRRYVNGEEVVVRIGESEWRVDHQPEFRPEFNYAIRSDIESGMDQSSTPVSNDDKFDYIFMQLRKMKFNLIITSAALTITIMALLILFTLHYY